MAGRGEPRANVSGQTYYVKVSGGGAPVLAFSTLGCPEWDAETVVERAAAFRYDGIEWRGGPDGTVSTAWSAADRRRIRRRMADAGLTSVAVTAYPNLITSDRPARQRSVREIRSHVDLAADLGAGSVRVFVGIRDDAASDEALVGRAVDGLQEALDHGRERGVGLAIEPHDDHVRAESIRPILAAIPDPLIGVAWDIANAWSVGEDPEEGVRGYAGRIRYVQVKDGVGQNADWRLCGLGDGEVPLERALRALVASTADGRIPPISLEWERAWHPDLAPPDVALPAARSWLAACFERLR